MTKKRLTHLDYVTQLLNLKFEEINDLVEKVLSELQIARVHLLQIMSIQCEGEEENNLDILLKYFDKPLE